MVRFNGGEGERGNDHIGGFGFMSSAVINPYVFSAGGTFDPTSIAGLELWLDASDSTTLFDATSGGSLPADGGAIKRWEDKSGGGRHLTESTKTPTRQIAEVNGLDVVDFTAVADDYLSASHAITIGTVFCVFSYTANVYGYWGVMEGRTGGIWGLGAANTNNVYELGGRATGVWKNGASGNVSNFNTLTGISITVGETNLISYTTAWADSGSKTIALGIDPYDYADNARNLEGNIMEILIYSSALGTSDREAVESYLMDKWGIV